MALRRKVDEFARQREAELSEQKAKEEAKRQRELAERRLANKEIEKFRERVGHLLRWTVGDSI